MFNNVIIPLTQLRPPSVISPTPTIPDPVLGLNPVVFRCRSTRLAKFSRIYSYPLGSYRSANTKLCFPSFRFKRFGICCRILKPEQTQWDILRHRVWGLQEIRESNTNVAWMLIKVEEHEGVDWFFILSQCSGLNQCKLLARIVGWNHWIFMLGNCGICAHAERTCRNIDILWVTYYPD